MNRRVLLLVVAGICLLAGLGVCVWRGATQEGPGPRSSETTSTAADPSGVPATTAIAASGRAARASVPLKTPQEHLGIDPECQKSCGSECDIVDGRAHCAAECVEDGQCGEGTICVPAGLDADSRRIKRCLGSNCSGPSDQTCGESRTCFAMPRPGGTVYRCEEAGSRAAGEACRPAMDQIMGCAPGLFCANGTCVPAECHGEDDCPRGTHCYQAGPEGDLRTCMPSCEQDADCPATQRCIDIGLRRMCIEPELDLGCIASGCADGQVCYVDQAMFWNLHAVCVRACGEGFSACEAGTVCTRGLGTGGHMVPNYCARGCATSSDCADAETCAFDDGGNRRCIIDGRAAARRRLSQEASEPAPGSRDAR
jgi:hypothetical protein